MSKAGHWRKIFGHVEKEKVRVRVGGRVEELTDTQAYRFKELSQKSATPQGSYRNPFEQKTYSLGEAAFRLMVSEDEILEKAAAGATPLFTDVAGLAGRWRRETADGSAVDSAELTLRTGNLALTLDACREMAARGRALARRFAFPELEDPSATGFDPETLTVLSSWRDTKISFVPREPRWVDRDAVVLLAPLRVGGNGPESKTGKPLAT